MQTTVNHKWKYNWRAIYDQLFCRKMRRRRWKRRYNIYFQVGNIRYLRVYCNDGTVLIKDDIENKLTTARITLMKYIKYCTEWKRIVNCMMSWNN